jgi:hypothetical protein
VTHDGSTQTRPLADDAARGMPRLPLWAASLTIETGRLPVATTSGNGGATASSSWSSRSARSLAAPPCSSRAAAGLYLTGIVGMAVVLAVWAVSRTVDAPIGPDGVGPEPISLLDGAYSHLEATVICVLLRLLRRPSPAPLAGALAGNRV